MQSKIIKYLCIAFTISNVSTIVSPMTISVPMTDLQIPVVTFLKLKPYPLIEYIGQYKCDRYITKLKNWLKGQRDRDTGAMFAYSNARDVSNFLHVLAKETGDFEVIELDYRQELSDMERKKNAFKRAQEVYDKTGRPAIIHAYHSRTVSKKEENSEEFIPALTKDSQVLELLKECGEYQDKIVKRFDKDYENRPCIIIYTTEGSKNEFSLDVRSRIFGNLFHIHNEYVYCPHMCDLPRQIEEVQHYNEAAYYVNGLLTGGLVTGTAAGLYLAIKFLRNKQ